MGQWRLDDAVWAGRAGPCGLAGLAWLRPNRRRWERAGRWR
jgi:hypothetical protein